MRRRTRCRRLVLVALVFIGLGALGTSFLESPVDPSLVPRADVLGKAEVRERPATLSDGRTTSDAAASGLLRSPSPPATPTVAEVPAPATPEPTPFELRIDSFGGASAPSRGSAPVEPTAETAQDRADQRAPAGVAAPAGAPPQRDDSTFEAPATGGVKQTLVDRADGFSAPDDLRELGEAATAAIGFPWQESLPGWSVVFTDVDERLRGLTRADETVIEIYVRPTDSPRSLARVLAHELGHAVDLTHLGADDRSRWRELRGIGADIAWWPGSGAADFATGAGDFAECFATWQVGSASASELSGPCGPSEVAFIRAILG